MVRSRWIQDFIGLWHRWLNARKGSVQRASHRPSSPGAQWRRAWRGSSAHAAFTSRTSSSTIRSNSSVDVGFQQPTRYEFPAEHGIHIRSYVIESSFATIRHRTDRTKGCLTSDGMLAMIYKLGQSAERSWRRLRGFEWLAKVVEGVKSGDGIEVKMQTRVKPNQPNTIAA